MTWFAGTDTGNRYTVGQSYTMGGREYVALPSGQFLTTTRDGGIRTTVGSSQSAVEWGGFGTSLLSGGQGDSPSRSGGSGPGKAVVVSDDDQPVTGGAGVPAAVSLPAGVNMSPLGPVSAGGMLRAHAFELQKGFEPGVVKQTPIYVGGVEISRALGWSDAGEAEEAWGELGGSMYGLARMGADFSVTGVKLVDELFQQEKLVNDVVNAASSFSQFLDDRRASNAAKADKEWAVRDYTKFGYERLY